MTAIRIYRRRLPHWRVDGATYWRLHESQPALTGLERTVIADALKFFDGERYSLYSFVVMDDHVHVVVRPQQGHELEQILKSWKGFTSTTLRKTTRRQTPLWQGEYMDRIIRDEGELEEKVNYVLDNPFRRWQQLDEYEWAGLGRALEN
jgi:REP element-mobilizing transposase RayT